MTEQKKRLFRLRSPALAQLRRLFALLLAIALSLQLLPQAAAEDIHPPTASETQEETSPETTEPAYVPPDPVEFSFSSEKPASLGSSMTNTYMLEVSTGSNRGGGTADHVKYFVIYYTDINSLKRSEVIFPGKDDMKKSMDAASAVANRNNRRGKVESVFGYTTEDLNARKGLGSNHTDQYLFTTPAAIDTIDRIQIFGRLQEEIQADGSPNKISSVWACQSMHVARVDMLYGLEMYGWYSDDGYIDYKGEIIADVVMPDGGGIFRWQNSAGVHNLDFNTKSAALINTDTVANYHKPNFVGTQHDSQVTNRLVFRLELADMGKAGFESLAGSYAAGFESKIRDLHFCETAAIKIRYLDIYGAVRVIYIPVIVNSLGWTMEKMGDELAIAGFAQQGDSVPISLMLPDFSRLLAVDSDNPNDYSVEMAVGEAKARDMAHLKNASTATSSLRAQRVSLADSESFAYLCLAAYRDVVVGIQHDSATLRYTYTAGSKQPMYCISAGSVEGVSMDAGTQSVLPMDAYRENMKIMPYDNRDIYLFTFCTDNVENAGMVEDITIQLKYINYRDKPVTTSELSLKEYAKQYYGEWAGNVDDFGYKYGLQPSGTLKVLIPFINVKKFESISIKVSNNDEWQFRGIRIQKVESFSPRITRWHEIDQKVNTKLTLKSHVMVSRSVVAGEPIFQVGTIYDKDHPVIPSTDDSWTPGDLVVDDGEYHTYSGSGKEIGTQDPINWDEYRYYMTYEDTLKDLGFDQVRCNYLVTVKVAGRKSNASDDDCGSANLFYFQLLFENGSSGCVLANQQLHSDGFRTGEEAEFYIPTTQDYGELESIRIIPDDQDSNGDIYDKLQIEYIRVKKQSTGKINPTWTAASDSVDGLGWVGIDYRDPGEAGSNRGAEGRTIEELARTFEITSTSYSTKLLISITTGEYTPEPVTNNAGETSIVTPVTMQGGLSAIIHYQDHEGRPQSKANLDLVHLMNQYSGREDNYVRYIDGTQETVDFCISDPDYQFREGRQDKFFVDIDNIHDITKMELTVKSSVNTKWTINNVMVYLVQGEGHRVINGHGEYDYKYDAGQELSLRCCWDRPQALTKDIQRYRPPSGSDNQHAATGSSVNSITINFAANEFPIGEDETWSSTLSREPESKNDTLNLFVYPSTDSTAADPESYGLSSRVFYTDTLTQTAMEIKTGEMRFSKDSTGQPVFYAVGLNANYFESLSSVRVDSTSVRTTSTSINHAIVQRVRGGVLIDSYYLQGPGLIDNGVSMAAISKPGGDNYQHVLLQINDDAETQKLVPEERDLAVAIHCITDDPYGSELRTKYIYLSDQGYRTIHGGEVLDLKFSIANLKEVTGINLVNMGRLNISLVRGEVIEQTIDGAVTQKWSFRDSMTPTKNPARFPTKGSVSLLDLDLQTALSVGTLNSGTDGPIRMIVGYLDMIGNETYETYDDITKYCYDEKHFEAGHLDHIRLLIPEMSELRYITLEPLSKQKAVVTPDSVPTIASWKLDSLTASVDLGFQIPKIIETLIEENRPLRISFAEVLLGGFVSTIRNKDDTGTVSGDFVIPTGGSLDISLNIGDGVRIVPAMQGSREGIDAVLNRYDPTTDALGHAELADTRGYTQDILNAYAQAARQDGRMEEAAFWSTVTPDEGYYATNTTYDAATGRSSVTSVIFMPPHNYTGATIYYRITLTSQENDMISVYVTVAVPSETDPLTELLAEARAKDEAASAEHVHDMLRIPSEAPTCTQDGNISYYSCAGCRQYFSDAHGDNPISLSSTVIPALGHSFGAWTHNSSGGHSRVCNRCGYTETDQYCNYGDWESDGAGKHYKYCDYCRDAYNSSEAESTCAYFSTLTPNGHTQHKCVCSRCGYTWTEACKFDKLVEEVPPTATEEGYKLYSCKCGNTEKRDITPALDPTEPTTEATEPTEATTPAETQP